MPRKAKEKIVENDIIDEVKDVKKEETKKSRKKSAVAKKTATQKNTAEKEIIKKDSTKKNTVKKDSTPKDTTKKVSTKKTSTKTSKAAPKKIAKDIDSAEEKVTTKRGRKKSETKVETIDDSATKSSKKTSTEKKATTTKKKSATEKTSTTKKKSTTAKTTTTKKKAATTKTTTTKKKAATTAKKKTAATKSTTTRKRASTKKSAEKTDSDIQILEYYDLPYKYGNTIVKLLAQTPKTLFVYWEISDDDINNFKQQYGDEFFSITKPILIVHNLTLNKTSEVEINDFANCWYLNTEDADCKYDIELARKFTKNISSNAKNAKISVDEYLYVAKSNDLQAPNDHIMFENLTDVVTFKNYKTNETIEENAQSFKFLKDIYKFYQNMYKDELLKNPSSKF